MKTAPAALRVGRTEGCRIHLEDGRALVDGIASWWTACHGYNHPHIREAVVGQIERMPHVMFGGLTHDPAERLASELGRLLPGDLDHVFFTESGSVSVEVALKMSAQAWQSRGRPQKRRFVSFRGAYHGDTFATMALCDPEEGMHTRFRGLMPEPLVADLPVDDASRSAFERLLEARRHEVAGVVVEPLVQCAGGFRFHDAAVLAWLRQVCDRAEVHLIFDEIAVGFGRLGSMFACERAGVVPDVITLSKALTAGTLPLAATVARTPIFESFWDDDPKRALMHGPTFMANPTACTAALASLELFEREPVLPRARDLEGELGARLEPMRRLKGVADVRTRGAIGVVELEGPVALESMRSRFVDHGAWIRPLGRCVYLMPAFVITSDELDQLAEAIRAVLTERAAGL
jgi:adenosylmethionine-8-amino-7-oxononanoate aminotransferase